MNLLNLLQPTEVTLIHLLDPFITTQIPSMSLVEYIKKKIAIEMWTAGSYTGNKFQFYFLSFLAGIYFYIN